MFRKSILASTLSLLLLPSSSWALGVGGLRPESALNQPFAGEIELVGANPDELDAIKVVLAPEAEFAKRGVDRQQFLSKLRFKPQISPRGKTVIRVTSTEPVREPYMDFLVEVIWPKGRIVKGFTVLLDPPVTARRSAPAVERPVASAPAAPAPKPVAAPAPKREPAPPVVSPPARAPAPVAAEPSVKGEFPLRTRPIKAGTGLWRTARNLAPPGATVAQTAMALYRNNQQAFVQGDINRLRQGQVLQVPSSAELFAMDAGAAEREFRAALAGKRVTAKPLTDVAAAAREDESRLKIAGAAQTAERRPGPTRGQAGDGAAGGSSDMEQELLLVRETGESTRQETDELRQRVRLLESNLAEIQQVLTLRDAELARLQGAETPQGSPEPAVPADAPPTQQAQAQQTLAQAQPQPIGGGAAPGPSESGGSEVPAGSNGAQTAQGPVSAPEAKPGPAPEASTETTADTKPAADPKPITDTKPAADPKPTADAKPAEDLKPITDAKPAAESEAKPPEGPTLAAAKPNLHGLEGVSADGPGPRERARGGSPGEPAVGGGSWLDAVPSPVLWSLAFAAPVLGLLGWLSVRRRRRIEESLSELHLPSSVNLHDEATSMMSPMSETTEAFHEPEMEEAALPESNASYMAEDDGDESDVISEADIYIAYGRYRDAEGLLKQAIARAPRRVDLHYKLADVYAGARNQDGLATLMDEMEAARMDQEHPDQWDRLVALARSASERAPATPVASSAPVAASAAAGLGTFSLSPAPAAGGRGQAEERDLYTELGFSAPAGDLDSMALDGTDSLVADDIRSHDLNLGLEDLELDMSAVAGTPGQAPYSTPGLPHTGDGDMELTMADLTPATEFDLAELGVVTPPLAARPEAHRSPADDDFFRSLKDEESVGDLESLVGLDTGTAVVPDSATSAPSPESAWAVPVTSQGRPTRGFGSGPGVARFELGPMDQDTASSDLLSSQWQMDGGMWDEVATKLDLGRAYVEMNDRPAAQAILAEVMEEGNPEQQAEARDLLAQLKPS